MVRSQVYKQGQAQRKKLDPYSNVAQKTGEQGEDEGREDSQETGATQTDPRLARLQVVPISRIKASHYQHRDELNVAEDKEYQQLLAQVQADLELQPDNGHKTIEHVFVVMPDSNDELILSSGGHRRYQVCLDLGVKEVYVWIKDYNEAALATGTYTENKGRKKTNWLEDARTYQDIMASLGWNQTEVAQYLHVEGGQPHVSRCLSMLDYHPDLQRMLAIAEERGMRAAKELARLEKLFGPDKARELWTPLIAGFLNGELFTDDIEKKVKQLLGEEPDKVKKTEAAEFPVIRRQRLAQGIRKKWQSFRSEIGDEPLDDEVRTEVETIYREMGELLGFS
jgi:ParB/RepB/Spo0J family partition protein